MGAGVNKFGARKVAVDGITFDSRAEARRFCELQLLAKAGEISDLQRQVPFEVVPKCGKNRPVMYKADFVYTDRSGARVVEDVKGVRTKEYVIKRKLMLWRYGIEVMET